MDLLGDVRQERWRLLLDAMTDGISIHAADGRIEQANQAVAAICGKSRDELIGLYCSDVFHRGSGECPHEMVVLTGQNARVEFPSDDGGRFFRVTLDPISDGGEVVGYIRVTRDVTERVRTQEALVRAERFATLGQMISGIAHDVGTPLSIISGYTEYLLMRTTPGGPGHKELSTILNQTRRIAEFIRQLLDLARPDQGRSDAIGLKGFLDEVVELMGHHLRKAGVTPTLVCKVRPPLIYGDAPRLRQALFNLLMNACQCLGAAGQLEITLDESAGQLGFVQIVLSGVDGAGKPHDFAGSFAGFISPGRTDRVTGLGLSLTREILDGFGAKVASVETAGGGSALSISLPISAKDPA